MTYTTRTTHSQTYYGKLCRTLIDCLKVQASDKAISDRLNSELILSPSGRPWIASDIKQALHRLRNYESMPSKLHQAVNQLVFDQVLHITEALVLFSTRRAGNVM